MAETLTDDQDWALSILAEHGASRFLKDHLHAAAKFLCAHGYASDHGRDGLFSITPRGLRYLNTH